MASKKDIQVQEKNKRLLIACERGPRQIFENEAIRESLRLWKKVASTVFDPGHPRIAVLAQLVRSVNSVGANIAEGIGFGDGQNLIRFAKIARGSAYESIIHAESLELDYVIEFEGLAKKTDEYLAGLIDDAERLLQDELALEDS